MKFDAEGHIENKSILVQVKAWRHAGDKPLLDDGTIRWRNMASLSNNEA